MNEMNENDENIEKSFENENNEDIEQDFGDENNANIEKDFANETVIKEEPSIKNTGNKKRFILFGLLGIVILGIVTMIVMLVIILSSPKNVFFGLMGKAMCGASESFEELNKSTFGKILAFDPKDKVKLNTEIELKVSSEEDMIKSWLNGFNKLNVIINDEVISSDKYYKSDIKLLINDEQFANGEILSDNDRYSVKIDELTGKYISADRTKLNELWDKIGITGPETLMSPFEVVEKLKVSKSEAKTLQKAFGRVGRKFSSVFSNEDFTTGSDSITYNGKTEQYKYIDLHVSSTALNNGIILALEQLKKEGEAIDDLINVTSGADDIYKQLGYEMGSITREEFIESIDSMLSQISELEFAEDDGGILRLYYKNNKPIKIELFFEDYLDSTLGIIAIEEGPSKYYEYYDSSMKYTDNVVTEKGITTHTIASGYIDYTTGEILDEYTEDMKFIIDDTKKDVMDVYMWFDDGYVVKEMKIKCNIDNNASFEKAILSEGDVLDTTLLSSEELSTEWNKFSQALYAFANKYEEKLAQLDAVISIFVL